MTAGWGREGKAGIEEIIGVPSLHTHDALHHCPMPLCLHECPAPLVMVAFMGLQPVQELAFPGECPGIYVMLEGQQA